jgi:hypothetical protein
MMLKLSAKPIEPDWLDLIPGVRVKVREANVAARLIAREAAMTISEAVGEDRVAVEIAFTLALARWSILEWEGVGDMEGEPLPVTPNNIDLLMDHYPAYRAFDSGYVLPTILADMEKNVSSPSPNGTMEGAMDTAELAKHSAPNAPTPSIGHNPPTE